MKKFKNTVLAYALIVSAFMLSVFAAYSFIDVDSLKLMSTGADKVASAPAIPAKDNSFSVKSLAKNDPQKAINPEVQDVMEGKAFFLGRVDGRLNQLRPFTVKLEKMAAVNDADRQALVKELTAEMATLAAYKTDVNASKTRQDLLTVADKIKAEWLKSRASVERAKVLMMASRGNQMVADAEETSASIQKKIEKLKASGKNVKPLEQFYAAYNKNVALAKQNVASANTKSDAAGKAATDAEKLTLVKEKEELLKVAQSNIKDAYHLFTEEAHRDFNRRIK